jgi:hypothetical protein
LKKADLIHDATFGCRPGEAIRIDVNSNFSGSMDHSNASSQQVASDGNLKIKKNNAQPDNLLEFDRSYKRLNSEGPNGEHEQPEKRESNSNLDD